MGSFNWGCSVSLSGVNKLDEPFLDLLIVARFFRSLGILHSHLNAIQFEQGTPVEIASHLTFLRLQVSQALWALCRFGLGPK